jgi:hypothetical protein
VLLVGAVLCAEPPSVPSAATNVSSTEWRLGLLGCVTGALSFALQAVGFEGGTDRVVGGLLVHTAAFALYGLVVNTVVLAALHPVWLMSTGLTSALTTMQRSDALTAFSIAGADLTMAVFFSVNGANAYSFSRVLALAVSAAIAESTLGLALSTRFLFGASLVAASGWVYHEHERVRGWCAPHGGYARVATTSQSASLEDYDVS